MASIKIKATQEFFNTPIEALDLTQRGFNALKRGGINTLDQLTDRWAYLEKINALGKLTIKQVKNAFINYYIETVLGEDEDKVEEFLDSLAA